MTPKPISDSPKLCKTHPEPYLEAQVSLQLARLLEMVEKLSKDIKISMTNTKISIANTEILSEDIRKVYKLHQCNAVQLDQLCEKIAIYRAWVFLTYSYLLFRVPKGDSGIYSDTSMYKIPALRSKCDLHPDHSGRDFSAFQPQISTTIRSHLITVRLVYEVGALSALTHSLLLPRTPTMPLNDGVGDNDFEFLVAQEGRSWCKADFHKVLPKVRAIPRGGHP